MHKMTFKKLSRLDVMSSVLFFYILIQIYPKNEYAKCNKPDLHIKCRMLATELFLLRLRLNDTCYVIVRQIASF